MFSNSPLSEYSEEEYCPPLNLTYGLYMKTVSKPFYTYGDRLELECANASQVLVGRSIIRCILTPNSYLNQGWDAETPFCTGEFFSTFKTRSGIPKERYTKRRMNKL